MVKQKMGLNRFCEGLSLSHHHFEKDWWVNGSASINDVIPSFWQWSVDSNFG
jgi:hypothetical protein